MFQTPGNFYFKRPQRSELYGITYKISPKATVCTDDQCIIFIELYMLKSKSFCIRFTIFFNGHKFIKYPVISKKQHSIISRHILGSKKTFTRIINLQVIYWSTYQTLHLLTVRGKRNSAVDI